MTGETTTPSETCRTLRERARILASEPERQAAEGVLEVLEFTLAHERYAIETDYLLEAHPLNDLTPLPCAPSFVAGIVNVRGRILAVIDMKKFFDLPEKGIADAHHLLHVRTGAIELCVLADTVIGVRFISKTTIQARLPTLTGIREDFLKGVTEERLVILDAARIMADSRITVDEKVEP